MSSSNYSFNQYPLNTTRVKQTLDPGETEMFKTGIVSACAMKLIVYGRVSQLQPFGAG